MMLNSKEVALIGAGGQLASDLSPLLAPRSLRLARADLDITSVESIEQGLKDFAGNVVINTAGYNLVDQAELEPDAAFAINSMGVRNLARYCADRGLKLVHISSDYVVNADPSRKEPLPETVLPQPLGAYAVSKLNGEQFVQAYCPDHLIIRTCGLYGRNATRAKGNFIETMLRLASTRPELSVVDDQHCTPSYTVDVARGIVQLIAAEARGIVNVTNSGDTTWCQLAREVFRQSGVSTVVRPITTAEFGARANRPSWSVLDLSAFERWTGTTMPVWMDAVARYLASRG